MLKRTNSICENRSARPPLVGGVAIPLTLLFVIAVVFRLPPLVNARGVHSDAAIVGLQAMHMLHGEFTPFLWGVRHQGSLDSLLIAIGFLFAGRSALTLMLVPFAGYLIGLVLVFDMLRRRIAPLTAAFLTIPILFTPAAINGIALYAPRQWCITCVLASIWTLDGASESRTPFLRYFTGALLGVLSVYLDLYGLQYLGGLGFFALTCCLDGQVSRSIGLRRVGSCFVGLVIGSMAVVIAHYNDLVTALATSSASATATEVPIRHDNLRLLLDTCLPWLLGYRVLIPGAGLLPEPWVPPAGFHYLQLLSAWLLMLGISLGIVWLLFRRVPWSLRKFGMLGFLVTATALSGFLISDRPQDMWSARYLTPILWTAPFALAPLAVVLGTQRFAAGILTYAVTAAVGGWVSYGEYVHGALPVREPRGVAHDEARVADFLRQRGVRYAAAQYWLSYRLTFLFDENPIVVPLDPAEDRYSPYRTGFERAPVVAYIFHPSEPRSTVEQYEPILRTQPGTLEKIEVSGFSILIYDRNNLGPMDPIPKPRMDIAGRQGAIL